MIGCPIRLVVSEKTLSEQSVEIKMRNSKEFNLIKIDNLTNELENK